MDQCGPALPTQGDVIAPPTNVDQYLAGLPARQRLVLGELRRAIREAAPGATETIAYNMPAYRHRGKFLVSFSAFKDHCSLFPATEAIRRELGGELAANFSGKGTIRFTVADPLPYDVVRRIVELRLAELDQSDSRGQD
jgi:uncharacterized protein YdhG (YjbR/CyaY superfamily)